MTNKNNTTIYVGVKSDLVRRVWEHKNKIHKGFTSRYNIDKLIRYEVYGDEITAIQREKTLKNYHRDWKFHLVKQENPDLIDLYPSICS